MANGDGPITGTGDDSTIRLADQTVLVITENEKKKTTWYSGQTLLCYPQCLTV